MPNIFLFEKGDYIPTDKSRPLTKKRLVNGSFAVSSLHLERFYYRPYSFYRFTGCFLDILRLV